jgi:hypothetical protein
MGLLWVKMTLFAPFSRKYSERIAVFDLKNGICGSLTLGMGLPIQEKTNRPDQAVRLCIVDFML